jgi:hypothetical protein
MNAATKTFLNVLSDALFDADNLNSARRTAMLGDLKARVTARDLSKFGVDVEGIELTEAQWTKIQRNVSASYASALAEA